jgi:hypothetical protein
MTIEERMNKIIRLAGLVKEADDEITRRQLLQEIHLLSVIF